MEDFSTPPSSSKVVHTITGKSENQSFKNVNEITKSRNATPTYELSNFFYYFSATADNQTTQTLATSKNSFTFTLQNATWIISCEIYYGTNLTESTYSNGIKLFVGSTTLTLTDESPTLEDVKIQTLPYTESDSKGSANLLIYTETTSVKSAIASWENLSTKATGTQVLDLTQQDSSENYYDIFNFDGNSVQAGVYKVVFKFYSGEVASGSVTGIWVCSTTKIVNIANSLLTDEWTADGGFIQNGKFSISTNNISISNAKAIYVDGDATTNGNGVSVSSPLNSFEDAVSLVEGFEIDAPICIKSGTTATFASAITISKNMMLTTYDESGIIYNDASTILETSKRGIIKRTKNVSISVSESTTLTICNVNFTESVDAISLEHLFYYGNSGGKLVGNNSSITSNCPLIMYATSVSATLSNIDFIGSSKTSTSCVGIFVQTSSSLTIKNSSFTGYYDALSFGTLATSVSISISDTKFTDNRVGINAVDASISLTLENLTVSNNSSYGIRTKKNISFLGTCTLNDDFYFDSDDVTINFDSTYKNADGNSVSLYTNNSYYTRGRQVLTGENVSTNYSIFSMEKSDWAINSNGYLYETNTTSAINQYYYVNPTNGDDTTAEGGNYDKAYKTLQGAVDAINMANATTRGKVYTLYLLGDLQIDSSTTFTTTSDESDIFGTISTISTPTLCNVENASSNELTLNVLSWATNSASYSTISGDGATVGRIFKVNGFTSAINLSVDNLNITNLYLYEKSSTKYFGAVLFMCGSNDTATFGSGVTVSDCTTFMTLFYPHYGTLNLNCSITKNKSDYYGVGVKLLKTGTLNFIGGEISSSTDLSGNAQADISSNTKMNMSGGKVDYIRLSLCDFTISNDAYVGMYELYNSDTQLTIDDTYTTTDISKIIYNSDVTLYGGETVFSIADSSSLTVADVIDRFAIYDSLSATSPSSIYSLEADSTGKKALLKIKTNSSSGSTTTPFDSTVTFNSTASDSLVYGSENKITITAVSTSGKAITWGDVEITTFGGTEISDATYVNTTKKDGTSSTATCVVTFTSSMPPGTYYINLNAEMDGVMYSGNVTAVVK